MHLSRWTVLLPAALAGAVRALLVAYGYEKDPKSALAQWEGNLVSMRGDSRQVFSTAIAKVKAAGGAR